LSERLIQVTAFIIYIVWHQGLFLMQGFAIQSISLIWAKALNHHLFTALALHSFTH